MKTQRFQTTIAAIALSALVMSAGGSSAKEETYHFGVSDQRSNITFESVTDFETVLGSTHKLMGHVTTDMRQGNAEVELIVPVASLKTGIDMRDDHLRSPMWLDAETFPTISFASTEVKKQRGSKWSVEGEFTLHGVTRDIKTKADVRQIPMDLAKKAGLEDGNWVKVTTEFELKLSDYGVMIPKMAAAKVSDTWKVTYVAYASTAAGQHAMNPCGAKTAAKNPCNPCGKMAAKNPCNPCG
jgi:polyisoprenoid-binding protein YceI